MMFFKKDYVKNKPKKVLIKIGDRVKIKNEYGIHYDEKKAKKQQGALTGIVRSIYRNAIYKIQLDPTSFYYCEESDIRIL